MVTPVLSISLAAARHQPFGFFRSEVNRQCSSSLQATAAIAAFIKARCGDVGLVTQVFPELWKHDHQLCHKISI